MTVDDGALRRAAGDVRAAAAQLQPPTAAAARRRQQARARLVAMGSAVTVLLIVGVALRLGSDDLAVRVADGTSVGSIPGGPGTGPGTVPGTTTAARTGSVPGSTAAIDPDGEATPPTPTSSAPTTSSTLAGPVPPTTTTPTSEAMAPVLDGTYDGIEHYALFTSECPNIRHHLDASVATDAGSWTYLADYCGVTRDDGTWHGAGTTTLTAPDGSTLSGRFEHTTPAGTDGEPYDITITGGSGRFTGAEGSCRVTVHVVVVQIGEQRQSGTLTCRLAV